MSEERYLEQQINKDLKIADLERQIKEDRRDHLKDTRVLLKELAEAREAINKLEELKISEQLPKKVEL